MAFYPHEAAAELLAALGIDYDEIYNDQGGIQRAQLSAITALSNKIGSYVDPNTGKETTLKINAYETITRLSASKNKKINFPANLKNTLEGTVSNVLMDKLENDTTEKQKDTLIKWLPSTANEQDPFHALNYGKVMPLKDAINKGLGTRYGCQCGMQIIEQKTSNQIDNIINSAIE